MKNYELYFGCDLFSGRLHTKPHGTNIYFVFSIHKLVSESHVRVHNLV